MHYALLLTSGSSVKRLAASNCSPITLSFPASGWLGEDGVTFLLERNDSKMYPTSFWW